MTLDVNELDGMVRLIGATLVESEDVAGHFTCREVDNLAYALGMTGQRDRAANLLMAHAMGDGHEDDLHGDLVEEDDQRWVADAFQHAQGYVSGLMSGIKGKRGTNQFGDTYMICGKQFTDTDGTVLECTDLDGPEHEGECSQ